MSNYGMKLRQLDNRIHEHHDSASQLTLKDIPCVQVHKSNLSS